MTKSFLPVVDGLLLDAARKSALRPGQSILDLGGVPRELPRYFYQIDSEQTARNTEIAPGFSVWEFIETGVREADALRTYPKYMPCAITLLAAHLSVLRKYLGKYIHIAANGGYRSPGHAQSFGASRHQWGSAANIYRIGSENIDTKSILESYRNVVQKLIPAAWTRPFGHTLGTTSDHLHLDLGYITSIPQSAAAPSAGSGPP